MVERSTYPWIVKEPRLFLEKGDFYEYCYVGVDNRYVPPFDLTSRFSVEDQVLSAKEYCEHLEAAQTAVDTALEVMCRVLGGDPCINEDLDVDDETHSLYHSLQDLWSFCSVFIGLVQIAHRPDDLLAMDGLYGEAMDAVIDALGRAKKLTPLN